jgi:catalase-peroxidase
MRPYSSRKHSLSFLTFPFSCAILSNFSLNTLLQGTLLTASTLLSPIGVRAACPFATVPVARESRHFPHGTISQGWGDNGERHLRHLEEAAGDWGEPTEGYEAVMADIKVLLTNSQDFWPADFGNYGPFFVRLAWHSNGSYRQADGRGGAEGGRMRFDPEHSWEDNGNLDKALELLVPIKEKYGAKLSWGDLIVLAGDTAIQSMGGPLLGFCGGRVDDLDGSASIKLGPSEEQESIMPCKSIGQDGNCSAPLGAMLLELIYVDPAGHMGVPDPVGSVPDIRSTFARMGMNDTETVALTGGGHAFGKVHGACSDTPCGADTDLVGRGPNTVTSGFEGPWTSVPTQWDNEYFNNLLDMTYNLTQSPAGKPQWEPTNGFPIMMLTADLAFLEDDVYLELANKFASDISELESHFKYAWYKLVTRDMGPIERCLGSMIPPAQDFQRALPAAPATLPDFVPIRSMIQTILNSAPDTIIPQMTNLAYMCAFTYRETDHAGGCNGARIRFSPEKDWPENAGTQETLKKLQPVKDAFPAISYADLIVLSGQAAVESAGGNSMPFCGGRTDATNADLSGVLAPRHYVPATVSIRDDMEVKGLTAKQMVALAGRPVSDGTLSNDLFVLLSGTQFEQAVKRVNDGDSEQFLVVGSDPPAYVTAEEYALVQDPEFKLIVEEYAAEEAAFKSEFASAWVYMMTADRYTGPTTNVCTGRVDPTKVAGKPGIRKTL